jgi:kynureninase
MDPEQFAEAVDERTLFLATSHVFFTTGFIQDIGRLAEIAHGAGALCLIDGYHGAGQVPLDLSASRVDFYTTGPLKWLCGGPGLAYLYVRPDRIPHLQPRITGWFGASNAFDFDIRTFEPHDDARRFEVGTPALPTVHTALGGQEILDEVGMEAVAAQNRRLTELLVKAVVRGAGPSPWRPTRATLRHRHDPPPGSPRGRDAPVEGRHHRGPPARARPGEPPLLQHRGGIHLFLDTLTGFRS